MKKKGFTLVELLVTVSIIGILMMIALPQWAAYRARGANALVEEAVRDAAAGQMAHFERTGTYASGYCEQLVGYRVRGRVRCMTGKVGGGFFVTTQHPVATVSCAWTSNPEPEEPNLFCGVPPPQG